MRAYERLLDYVKVYTTSDEDCESCPSAIREFDLAKKLVEELRGLGIENARVDDKCYVYATIPASKGFEDKEAIGFVAHMDTAPDFSGEGVNPIIIENYDGSDVALGSSGKKLEARNFGHLKELKGRTLIHTDGSTLLGADDKAGVAEIMTLAECLMKGDIEHGKVCIAFTPDEEIGRGADLFDVKNFGAKYAFTVDGGAENELEYENFNAASAHVEVKGESIHPGEAKDRMVNAALIATEFAQSLPAHETPAHTEGRDGFFHLTDMSGDVCRATLDYIIRDHDDAKFEAKKKLMESTASYLNEKYGHVVSVEIKEQYRNMISKIRPHMFLVEYAKEAIIEAGMTPKEVPVRGGTDGARLSYMGLPCPNLGTGGYAFHGPYEHITAEGMDKAVEVLLGIVKKFKDR